MKKNIILKTELKSTDRGPVGFYEGEPIQAVYTSGHLVRNLDLDPRLLVANMVISVCRILDLKDKSKTKRIFDSMIEDYYLKNSK